VGKENRLAPAAKEGDFWWSEMTHNLTIMHIITDPQNSPKEKTRTQSEMLVFALYYQLNN
jgi:hypothetical protein